MSKSDNVRYLDNNNTILRTANNLYKRALDGFNNARILESHEGLTPLVTGGYITARSQLTQALIFGNIEACTGLALFNQEGIGGAKSDYNQKLFLTIGSKRGHKVCTQALKNLQNNNYDVEKEASIWISHINAYKNLNAEITTQELATAELLLKNALIQNSIGLEVYNNHFSIIKSKEEIATNFVSESSSKQDYYYSSYDYNATATTSYTPPLEVQKKYTSKSLGQTPDKHHTCDIL